MTGMLYTQSFRFDSKANDWLAQWQSEEPRPRKRKYDYNPKLSAHDNAVILSDKVVRSLKSSYSILKIDPCPMAVPVWGDGVFGAEVFYHNQLGTMKISARVYI